MGMLLKLEMLLSGDTTTLEDLEQFVQRAKSAGAGSEEELLLSYSDKGDLEGFALYVNPETL